MNGNTPGQLCCPGWQYLPWLPLCPHDGSLTSYSPQGVVTYSPSTVRKPISHSLFRASRARDLRCESGTLTNLSQTKFSKSLNGIPTNDASGKSKLKRAGRHPGRGRRSLAGSSPQRQRPPYSTRLGFSTSTPRSSRSMASRKVR
jgi:hypothetical protein